MAIYDTGPFYNFLNAVTTVSVDLTNTTASSSIAYITLYTFTNRNGLGNESYPLEYPTINRFSSNLWPHLTIS